MHNFYYNYVAKQEDPIRETRDVKIIVSQETLKCCSATNSKRFPNPKTGKHGVDLKIW